MPESIDFYTRRLFIRNGLVPRCEFDQEKKSIVQEKASFHHSLTCSTESHFNINAFVRPQLYTGLGLGLAREYS